MRLQQYITELAMTADTKINWYQRDNYIHAAEIVVKTPHSPELKKLTGLEDEETRFDFHIRRKMDPASYFNTHFKDEIEFVEDLEITFSDENLFTTKEPKSKGVALKLFAAIEHIFKVDIPKIPHHTITFSGDADHEKLYNLLANRILKSGKYTAPGRISGGYYYFVKKDALK